MCNSRPLNIIFSSFLFRSYFLGGPSSKTMMPPSGGVNVPPFHSFDSQQQSMGLGGVADSDNLKIERFVALVMLAIIPGSFVYDSVFMNYLLAVSLAIHAHWGMNVLLIEYCPKQAFPIANIIRYVLTAISFIGLCYFNFNSMGLTKALKTLWAIH